MTWLKQTHQHPLYPQLHWSKPERRDQAGKLLIIGGNQYGFSAVGTAYAAAAAAGVGVARVLLPSKLRSTLSVVFPEAEFAPSTPSGSFARNGLADWLEAAAWADGVLLAGDFGHNSETALLMETFVQKHAGIVTISQDAAEYFLSRPASVIDRADTAITLSMGQLQKLAKHLHSLTPVAQAMGLPDITAWLEEFTSVHPATIITKHLDHLIIATQGQVSTTPAAHERQPWRVQTASVTTVWWLQHQTMAFEAMTSAILDL